MRTFMEVFVGSYKDGLDARVSKRDYRFTASLYLIGRVAIGFGWIKPGPKGPPVQHYTLLISAVPCIILRHPVSLLRSLKDPQGLDHISPPSCLLAR